MYKTWTRIFDVCSSCPSRTADQNITRWQCGKMRGRMICWMGEGEDSHPIPDWCPLPDAKVTIPKKPV